MNVSWSSGKVAVNFIHDWNQNRSVREILTKLYSVFYLVNPYSPFQREMADEYMKDKNLIYKMIEFILFSEII